MNQQQRDAEIKRLYLEGNSYATVAEQMGMPKSTVWGRLYALKVKMRLATPKGQQIVTRYVPGDPNGCGCSVCRKHR